MRLRAVALAFQFLTIIPVKIKGEVSEKDISDSSQAFPLVGAFQGLILSFSSLLFLTLFSPDVAAGLIILVYVLTNGGFHLDGLSDTFDALSIKSTGDDEKDREKRLAIMKDSTTGAIGAVAIWFTLFLKYLFMKETFFTGDVFSGCFILFIMPILSTWAMVSIMYHGKSARKDGLGRIFLENTRFQHLLVSTVLTLVICFAPLFIFHPFQNAGAWELLLFCLSVMIIIYVSGIFMTNIFTKRFGGITGDNFGAIHEITEIIFLVVALLWR